MSLSSLSDTAIKAGRKAKQTAMKTVKSFTALLKRPRKSQVIPQSEGESSLYKMSQEFTCYFFIADTEAENINDDGASIAPSSSMMDIDPSSTRASSEINLNESIYVSDDDSDSTEAKIIKDAEKKISMLLNTHQLHKYLYLLSADNLKRKIWRSVVYAFYKERPKVVRKDNRKGIRTTYLEFCCIKCSKPYLRGTGTDSGSTGVMREHIPLCWGEDVWNDAKNLELEPAKDVIKKFKTMKNVKLTEMLKRVPGSKETYSLLPPSREEIRYSIICQLYPSANIVASVTIARWVSESMRPFLIVKDRALRWLCKTGRPHFYLPDETTVAKDVKFLYSWSECRLAEELQVKLLFLTLMDTDVLLIEIPWPAGLPAGLLDIAESPSIHECLGFLDST